MPRIDFLAAQGALGAPGADGDDGASGAPGPPGPVALIFGNRGGVNTTITTRYLSPGNSEAEAGTTANSLPILASRNIDAMAVRHNRTGTGTSLITYTLTIDDVDTALTVSMAPTAVTEDTILGSPISVAAGQRVGVKVTKNGTLLSTPTDLVASIGLLSI